MTKETKTSHLTEVTPHQFQQEIQRLYEMVEEQKGSGQDLTPGQITAIKNILTAFSKMNFMKQKYMLAYTERENPSQTETIRGSFSYLFLFMWHLTLKEHLDPFIDNYGEYNQKLQFLKRALPTK